MRIASGTQGIPLPQFEALCLSHGKGLIFSLSYVNRSRVSFTLQVTRSVTIILAHMTDHRTFVSGGGKPG